MYVWEYTYSPVGLSLCLYPPLYPPHSSLKPHSYSSPQLRVLHDGFVTTAYQLAESAPPHIAAALLAEPDIELSWRCALQHYARGMANDIVSMAIHADPTRSYTLDIQAVMQHITPHFNLQRMPVEMAMEAVTIALGEVTQIVEGDPMDAVGASARDD